MKNDCSRRGFLRGLIAFAAAPKLLSFIDPLNEVSHLEQAGAVLASASPEGVLVGPGMSSLLALGEALKRIYKDEVFEYANNFAAPFAAEFEAEGKDYFWPLYQDATLRTYR